MTPDDLLTIEDAIAILRVPRSTFYYWRQKRRGPRSIKLPNGEGRLSAYATRPPRRFPDRHNAPGRRVHSHHRIGPVHPRPDTF